jgi:hypothetical protein
MWSQAERGLFVKFTGFFFLLACGIGWAVTAVATKFLGYSGYFTLVVAAACLLVSMLGSWVMLRGLKRRMLRGEDVVGSIKEIQARSRANPLKELITYVVHLPPLYFLWMGIQGRVGLAIAGAVVWFVVSQFILGFVFKRMWRVKNSGSLTADAATAQNAPTSPREIDTPQT